MLFLRDSTPLIHAHVCDVNKNLPVGFSLLLTAPPSQMDIHFEYTKKWHMRYPLNSLSILRWMNFHDFFYPLHGR